MVNVPALTSSVLPLPTVTSDVAIVAPSTVPPLISTVVTLPKSAIVFPVFVQLPCILSKSSVAVDVLPNEPVEVDEPLIFVEPPPS